MTAPVAPVVPPPSSAEPVGRVVMFVTNTVTHDSRVLREATTLREAGWEVTIVGRLPSGEPDLAAREEHLGLSIIRVPQPIGWLTAWRHRVALLRYPWRGRQEIAASLRRDIRGGGRGFASVAR